MELQIYSPKADSSLQAIEWNYDELKSWLQEKSDDYKNLVYGEDQIKDAKADRAQLNKLKKALNDKKIEVKKSILKPYETFEVQIKELIAILDEASSNADKQIKAAEEREREEKRGKINAIYRKAIGDLDRTVPLDKIFKSQWLNKSTSLKSIQTEIEGILEKVDRDLKMIGVDSSLYAYEMKEEYLKDFDLSAAMKKKQELEETAKKKAEYEEQKRIREEQKEKEEAYHQMSMAQPEISAIQVSDAGEPEVIAESERVQRRKRIVFAVTANEGQFDYLNKVLMELKNHAEKFEIVESEEL